MTAPLHEDSVIDIAAQVRSGTVSASAVLEHHLARIDRLNPELGAFVFLDKPRARKVAASVAAVVARGEDPGPLAGVPFGIKCLENVSGWPHTMASVVFKDRIASTTSTQVQRLLAAGAVPVGLTASPELGTATHTASPLYGICRSPWDKSKTPGGSSGGSSAAVSAGLVPMATGSDSGGSLRIPAAYCGLVGFKGTYGRVPRGPDYVGMPNVRHYGVLTRSVSDTAHVLDVICGADEHDPLSLPKPHRPFAQSLDVAALRGIRATFSSTLGAGACEPDIEAMARAAFDDLVANDIVTPTDTQVLLSDCEEAWIVLAVPDVSGLYRQHWPACADQIAPLLRDMLTRSSELSSMDFAMASKQRDDLIHALATVFDEVDLLITPTVGCDAFAADGPTPSRINGTDVGLLGSAVQTYLFNLSGHPAISVPLGTSGGTPVGLQIVGRRHEDALVLATAAAWEGLHPWPTLAPGY